MIFLETIMTIKQRDLGYDFIRFIATLMIVIHHFVTTLYSNNLHTPQNLQLLVSRGGGLVLEVVELHYFFCCLERFLPNIIWGNLI